MYACTTKSGLAASGDRSICLILVLLRKPNDKSMGTARGDRSAYLLTEKPKGFFKAFFLSALEPK
jgi:hypothetical protein